MDIWCSSRIWSQPNPKKLNVQLSVTASITYPGAMTDAGTESRWLSADEQRAWRAYLEATNLLFDALERQLQRAPFQLGDAGIIDNGALPQPGDLTGAFGERLGSKLRHFINIDIKRVQKQPAVRRIGAAIGGAIIEQRMQWIETDAVSSQMARQFN